ncbi:MAG: sulfotransferase [Cyanobacteria bacterium P01_A01_bin.123]
MYFNVRSLCSAVKATFSWRHFHPVHAGFVVVLLTLFFVLRTVVQVMRWCDWLIYPRFRQVRIKAPIYILGNPRSGTTYLHRLMALDQQFTSTKLYQTIFPAVVFYKMIVGLQRLDRYLGYPLGRLVSWLDRTGFRGWQGIHNTQLGQAEEDEQLFVYAALSPVMFLLFPFPEALESASFVDRLPRKVRQRLMAYYQDCLQRHLYAEGIDKTLLTKNTTMAGRLQATRELLPDLRVIHLVRHTYDAIPSFLSMNRAAWHHFVPQTKRNHDSSRAVARVYCNYFRRYWEFRENLPANQAIEVRYEDLIDDPKGTIERIYATLGLTMTETYAQTLAKTVVQTKQYQSAHRYSLEEFGLSKQDIYAELSDMFEACGFSP